ncbi:competence type IV pilus assembly protein ComGB [Alkalicoccus luteus]|uniref:Type II secretion system F family protein n=1 Tax=Alkalicoccus luteus TaxID=1237094 RepID=A0A969TTH1_9BACI|nr:competence type IV pilus assembly protein ComGB [Alkalicoccus luteus]NJP37658.1 type II secretion system F family protein [Alkalicoccus luteus]
MRNRRGFKNDLERGRLLLGISDLLKDGYMLTDAIGLYGSFLSGRAQEWLEAAEEQLHDGELFSDQLSAAGFTGEIVSYLKMMELHGSFQQGLENSGRLLVKRAEMHKELRNVLYYPIVLMAAVAVLGIVLMEGILPQFEQFFDSMGSELPVYTKLLLFLINWIRIPFIIVITAVLLLTGIWFQRLPVSRKIQLLLRVPGLRTYVKQLLTYFLCAQTGPLLQGGMSLHEALTTLEADAEIRFFQGEAASLKEGLTSGLPMTELIGERMYYMPQLANVWSFGESRGKLGEELEAFAKYMMQQIQMQTGSMIRLIQPAVFIVVGAVVMILFLSMMMPVFSIMESF